MTSDIVKQARQEMYERKEREAFQPGKLVMLHHACRDYDGKPHPDAGRIGKIVECDRASRRMIVEFWCDELVGSSTFCLIPYGHWAPVPDYMAEEYEPRAKNRGWRLNEYGRKIFAGMGWERTLATEGKA